MRATERLVAAGLLLGSLAAALSLPHLVSGRGDAVSSVSSPPRISSRVVLVPEPAVTGDPRSPGEARHLVDRARAAAHMPPAAWRDPTRPAPSTPRETGRGAEPGSLVKVRVSAPMAAPPASAAARAPSTPAPARSPAKAPAQARPPANRVLANDKRHAPGVSRHGPGAPKDEEAPPQPPPAPATD